VKIEEVVQAQMVLETGALHSWPLLWTLLKSSLTPLSCERESNCNKAETNNHVPCANAWDWVGSLAYVKDNDPKETDEEVSDHYWRKP
jgi:hypothetical protein